MIPILYESTEKHFTTNGLGRLADAISCIVIEERNGIYELEMEYPITGRHYADIQQERIIYVTPSDGANKQPFRIYRVTRPLDGVVTIYASHISYDLNRNTIRPFEASNCAEAIQLVGTYSVETNDFDFSTNNVASDTFKVELPSKGRSVLEQIQDVFGGEYEFDGFSVKLWVNRGSNNGITLRYGKNITELEKDTATDNVYTGIVPYWVGTDSIIVGNAVYSTHVDDYPYHITIPYDATEYFDQEPTVSELNAWAASWLATQAPWNGSTNIKVSFVDLSQTIEYEDILPLQRVKLCDTISIYHNELGVSNTAKVIKTEYNVLLDRYNQIEVGNPNGNNLTNAINELTEDNINEGIAKEDASLKRAIDHATDLITGGLGGYVVIGTAADGTPEEILIMDTNDKDTATNVIRMNKNGIAFSNTGYEGPFVTAWTIDGGFVADFINSGKMSANLIQGGTLLLGGQDDSNGIIRVMNSTASDVLVTIDNEGMKIQSNDYRAPVYASAQSLYVESYTIKDWNGTNTYTRRWGEFCIGAASRYKVITVELDRVTSGTINLTLTSIRSDKPNLTKSYNFTSLSKVNVPLVDATSGDYDDYFLYAISTSSGGIKSIRYRDSSSTSNGIESYKFFYPTTVSQGVKFTIKDDVLYTGGCELSDYLYINGAKLGKTMFLASIPHNSTQSVNVKLNNISRIYIVFVRERVSPSSGSVSIWDTKLVGTFPLGAFQKTESLRFSFLYEAQTVNVFASLFYTQNQIRITTPTSGNVDYTTNHDHFIVYGEL